MKGVAGAAIVVVLGALLYRLMAPPSGPSFESVGAYPSDSPIQSLDPSPKPSPDPTKSDAPTGGSTGTGAPAPVEVLTTPPPPANPPHPHHVAPPPTPPPPGGSSPPPPTTTPPPTTDPPSPSGRRARRRPAVRARRRRTRARLRERAAEPGQHTTLQACLERAYAVEALRLLDKVSGRPRRTRCGIPAVSIVAASGRDAARGRPARRAPLGRRRPTATRTCSTSATSGNRPTPSIVVARKAAAGAGRAPSCATPARPSSSGSVAERGP